MSSFPTVDEPINEETTASKRRTQEPKSKVSEICIQKSQILMWTLLLILYEVNMNMKFHVSFACIFIFPKEFWENHLWINWY